MPGISFTIEGLDDLKADLERAATALQAGGSMGELKSVMQRAAEPIRSQAQANAKGSIAAGVTTMSPSAGGGTVSVKIGNKEPYYAAFVEYGHGGPHGPAQPHPYLRPAFDASVGESMSIISAGVNEILAKLGL